MTAESNDLLPESNDDSAPEHSARVVETLLLAASAVALWPPIILVVLVFWAGAGGHGLGFVSLGDGIVEYFEYAFISGVVAVLVCAVVCKPWQRPSFLRGLFWLQAMVASVVVMIFIWAQYEGFMDARERAKEEAHNQLVSAHEEALTAALHAHDTAGLERALAACGEDDCPIERGEGLQAAVQAGDLATAATLLKGVTPESYGRLGYASTANVTVKEAGATYNVILSSAGLAAYAGNQQFIDLLLPHLNRDGLQQAFIGAAVGNRVDLMAFFVARGADPLRYMRLDDYGSFVGQVATTGAVDALEWLVKRGVRIGDEWEWDDAWRDFQYWIRTAPPDRVTKNIDEMSDLFAQATCDPSEPSIAAKALSEAVHQSNVRFARALLRHCGRADSLSGDDRLKLNAMLPG